MEKSTEKLHTIGLIMLALTAIFWGAGFVLNDQLQASSFIGTPALLNAFRFVGSSVALAVIFAKKLKVNKKILLFGALGGATLFGGFQSQLVGLSLSTPAHCGFFTASYCILVPFIAWIFSRKRPHWITFISVVIALAGLIILNVNGDNATEGKNVLIGDIVTFTGAILFALQIVISDVALKKEVDYANLTFWQVLFAAILFVLYSLIFETKNYAQNFASFDWAYCSWRLVIVVFCGTAFAYFSQSFAQVHASPAETSLILACESPIGMILSICIGLDALSWNIIVGGILVIFAVFWIEIANTYIVKRKAKTQTEPANDTPTDNNDKQQ